MIESGLGISEGLMILSHRGGRGGDKADLLTTNIVYIYIFFL